MADVFNGMFLIEKWDASIKNKEGFMKTLIYHGRAMGRTHAHICWLQAMYGFECYENMRLVYLWQQGFHELRLFKFGQTIAKIKEG